MAKQTDHVSEVRKMVTAVEWLNEKIMELDVESEMELITSKENYWIKRKKILEQAKQMEKEQIKKAYKDYHDLGHIYGLETELYYNETYGDNKD